MALRPTCDVFLTAVEGVKRYRIVIMLVPPQEEDVAIPPDKEEEITKDAPYGIFSREKDLCPRALERLKTKIVAGITPPKPKKKAGDEALKK